MKWHTLPSSSPLSSSSSSLSSSSSSKSSYFDKAGFYNIANGGLKANEGAWDVMGLPLWPASPSTMNKPPNPAMIPHTESSTHSSHCVNGCKESGWVGRSRMKRWTDALHKEKLPHAEICFKHLSHGVLRACTTAAEKNASTCSKS